MQQPAESSADTPQPHVPSPRADPAPPSPAADRALPSSDTDPAPPSSAADADDLSEREERILAFEAKWWKHAGSKEQAIRDTFGLSSTRYYQLLNALLDNPLAVAKDPVLVGRLRRLRSTRARTRRR
jgi:Protein of unknown function (DUF3263)